MTEDTECKAYRPVVTDVERAVADAVQTRIRQRHRVMRSVHVRSGALAVGADVEEWLEPGRVIRGRWEWLVEVPLPPCLERGDVTSREGRAAVRALADEVNSAMLADYPGLWVRVPSVTG